MVVEGCGTNGCEYMTGGMAVILGRIGQNFGAGMTGGMAFVYDPQGRFDRLVNPETLVWQGIETDHWHGVLKALVEEHLAETRSSLAEDLLRNWDQVVGNFVQVCPKEMLPRLSHPISDRRQAVPAE